MALQKAIKQDNGIILNYHRIPDIKNVVNDKTYINVLSYINNEERRKEQNLPKYSPNKPNIYKVNNIYSLPYNDTLTINEAYKYLKTLEYFEGSEDV